MDQLDETLLRCLALPDAEQDHALATECSARPEDAAELRRRFALLRAIDGFGPPDDETAADMPAEIGGYRILRRAGAGSMGVVYEALEPALGRRVALKVVRPELLLMPGSRQRFAREVTAVAHLRHPCILPIYRAGEHAGMPFCAMEWVEGATLADAIASCRHLSPASVLGRDFAPRCFAADQGLAAIALRVATEIASALQHAHEHGIVHRDVKPSNIILADDGRVLLLDFGLAAQADAVRLTRSGTAVGSLAYMAPEQLHEGRVSDARSDVHALGVTLAETLALQLPPLPSGRADVDTGARAPVAWLRAAHPGIGADLAHVVAKATEPDTRRRYASAAELLADLRAVADGLPVSAKPPGLLRQLRIFTRRRPGTAAAAAAVLALGTVLPTALWLAERQSARAIEFEARLNGSALDLLSNLFAQVDPYAQSDPDMRARDLLDRARLALATDPVDERVRAIVGAALGASFRNLGLHDEAERLLRSALAVQQSTGDSDRTAWSHNALALLLRATGRRSEAIEHFRTAWESYRSRGADRAAMRVQHNLATTLDGHRDRAEVEKLLREVVAWHRAQPDLPPSEVANVLCTLGHFLLGAGDGRLGEAASLTQEARELVRSDPQASVFLRARIDTDLCAIMLERGDVDDDFAWQLESCNRAEEVAGPLSRISVNARLQHASILVRQGRGDEAEREVQNHLERIQAKSPGRAPAAAPLWRWLGQYLMDHGRVPDALPAFEAGVAAGGGAGGDAEQVAELQDCAAYAALLLGQAERAERHARAALDSLRGMLDPPPRTVALAQAHLGWALQLRGELEAAETEYTASLEPYARAGDAARAERHITLQTLAALRVTLGRRADALPLAEQALAERRAMFGEDHPLTRESRQLVAELSAAIGPGANVAPGAESAGR